MSARKMKAPKASNSPCAKFKTLEDLKIITKPMAEIPYRNPMHRPLINNCRKKSISSPL